MKKSLLAQWVFLFLVTMMLSGCFIPIPVGVERDGGHRDGHDRGKHRGERR